MLCRYLTIVTQEQCLQTGADGVALKETEMSLICLTGVDSA